LAVTNKQNLLRGNFSKEIRRRDSISRPISSNLLSGRLRRHFFLKEVAQGGEWTRVLSISFIFSFSPLYRWATAAPQGFAIIYNKTFLTLMGEHNWALLTLGCSLFLEFYRYKLSANVVVIYLNLSCKI
jgi:hypothetical protein